MITTTTTTTVTKVIFSTPQAVDSPLHAGDLVSDIFNASRFGVVVGPGQRGIMISWGASMEAEDEESDLLEADPLQLILLMKAAQC